MTLTKMHMETCKPEQLPTESSEEEKYSFSKYENCTSCKWHLNGCTNCTILRPRYLTVGQSEIIQLYYSPDYVPLDKGEMKCIGNTKRLFGR